MAELTVEILFCFFIKWSRNLCVCIHSFIPQTFAHPDVHVLGMEW